MKLCKILITSDWQVSYEDGRSLKLVEQFAQDWQPDVVVFNGDLLDCTALGKYRLTLEERSSLEEEIERLRFYLKEWRASCPQAEMVYVMGNHEQRLQSYITDHAPELQFLVEGPLALERLLDIEDMTVVGAYGAAYEWHGVYVTHGVIRTENAAMGNLKREGSSGVSGHTHRLGSAFRRDRSGEHGWFECGCLCNLDAPGSPPPTFPGVNNWQQGFVYGYGRHDESAAHSMPVWALNVVPIIQHRFIIEGKVYE